MNFKETKQKVLRFLGNYLLSVLISFLCKTLKINLKNGDKISEFYGENKNFVLAFWHGTMLVPWFVNRNQNFTALVSKSKDGALLEKVLKHWNYKVIRGSSHTGGSVALGILIDYAKNESSIAITPDGPRGPKYKMKAGAVIAAKRAKIPLVLLGVGYRKKRELNSWDNFQIPGLFSKVNIIYSEPIYIEYDLSYEETSRVIEQCEVKLNELQKEANIF